MHHSSLLLHISATQKTNLFKNVSDLVTGEYIPPEQFPDTEQEGHDSGSGFDDFGFKESDIYAKKSLP